MTVQEYFKARQLTSESLLKVVVRIDLIKGSFYAEVFFDCRLTVGIGFLIFAALVLVVRYGLRFDGSSFPGRLCDLLRLFSFKPRTL